MHKPRNIIILCVDALRFDCIGSELDKALLRPYGVDELISTPTLDSLACTGTRFSHAITASNVTTTSLASMMTGVYPPLHGVREFFKHKLHSQIVTIAHVMKDAGYTTIAADELEALPLLSITSRGIDHSFRAYDPELWECIGEQIPKNIFLFMHVMDVHDPYLYSMQKDAPGINADYDSTLDNLLSRENIAPQGESYPFTLAYQKIIQHLFDRGKIGEIFSQYIKGINKFDRGRLRWILGQLNRHNMLDDSLFVIISDHGEGPGEHAFSHGLELNDGQIRVPFLLIFPGVVPRDKVIDCQVRSVDLFPTLLTLTGLSESNLGLPYKLDGQDLMPVVAGNQNGHREAYSEIWSHDTTCGEMMDFMQRSCEQKDIKSNPYDWQLYQRSVRLPPRKLIVRGADTIAHRMEFAGSDEDFVHSAYRKILRRAADASGFEHYVSQLRANRMDRAHIIRRLAESEESKNLQALYDINRDPFEANNLMRGAHTLREREAEHMLKGIMDRIENSSAFFTSEDIAYQSAEEKDKIENHLRALGYL